MALHSPIERRLTAQFRALVSVMLAAARRLRTGGRRGDDGGGMTGAPVPVPSGPPPGRSERGPRQRGPRAEATALADPEGGR